MFIFSTRGLDWPCRGQRARVSPRWRRLRSDPTLLDVLQVGGASDPRMVDPSKTELLLACPLSSLSARMRYLEDDLLAAVDPIGLATHAADLLKQFEKLNAGPVRIWKGSAPKTGTAAPSPTRALRDFLPLEEGGNDSARDKSKQRLEMFRYQLFPGAVMEKGFADQNLSIAYLGATTCGRNTSTSGAASVGQFQFRPCPGSDERPPGCLHQTAGAHSKGA